MNIEKFCSLVISKLKEVGFYQRIMRGKAQNLGKQAQPDVTETTIHTALTYIDMFTQDYLMLPIFTEFPYLVPVVEEDTGLKTHFKNNQSDYALILDPLDGTYVYTQGGKDYSIMVALVHKGKIIVGIGYYPEEDKIIMAIRGQGAWILDKKGNRISIPNLKNIKKIDRYNVAVHYRLLKSPFAPLAQNLYSKGYTLLCSPTGFGTNLTGILRILEGKSCAYIGPHVNLHDIAVPALIVEECGGTVAKFDHKGMDDINSWKRVETLFENLNPAKSTPRFRVIIADSEETVARIVKDML